VSWLPLEHEEACASGADVVDQLVEGHELAPALLTICDARRLDDVGRAA